MLINFLSCWTSISFLEARELTSVVWASMRKEWFRSWTDVLDKTASLIQNCTSAPTDAYPPSLVCILEKIIINNRFHNIIYNIKRSMASIITCMVLLLKVCISLTIVIGSNKWMLTRHFPWLYSATLLLESCQCLQNYEDLQLLNTHAYWNIMISLCFFCI